MKIMTDAEQTNTDAPGRKLNVAETFDTSSSLDDVETGAVAVVDWGATELSSAPNQKSGIRHANKAAELSDPATQTCGGRRRIGWITLVGGTVSIVTFFIGLSIGWTTKNENGHAATVGAGEEVARVPSNVPETSGENETTAELVQAQPENWFDLASSEPKPTHLPTSDPSTHPTPGPSTKPTPEPSPAPSGAPTSKPSVSPTQTPTTGSPTTAPTPHNPYYFGDEFVTDEELGIEMSRGLTVRLIARAGEKVRYADGEESESDWHADADAAGIVPLDPSNPIESGYVYVSNSETEDGGVHGLYFDEDGNIVEYRELLSGTEDNCGGGLTPWHTWVSCEETDGGQCWQVDPLDGRAAEETKLGGKDGGRYESVAVDNRAPDNPVFFTTEDDEKGALRRFVANGSGWDALHSDGVTTFLNILDDSEFEWTDDEDEGRKSAKKYYPNTEGIQVHEGRVYFMSKELQQMIILDLENMTYETEDTGLKFYGEGSFGDSPDQNLFGPTRKYIYFTEDGGSSPGVYARYADSSDGTYFTVFQAVPGGMHDGDETSGIALSPDHRRMYACIQHNGYCFEFMREDMLPFE